MRPNLDPIAFCIRPWFILSTDFVLAIHRQVEEDTSPVENQPTHHRVLSTAPSLETSSLHIGLLRQPHTWYCAHVCGYGNTNTMHAAGPPESWVSPLNWGFSHGSTQSGTLKVSGPRISGRSLRCTTTTRNTSNVFKCLDLTRPASLSCLSYSLQDYRAGHPGRL